MKLSINNPIRKMSAYKKIIENAVKIQEFALVKGLLSQALVPFTSFQARSSFLADVRC
jgi:hypothetical protein